MTTEIQHVARWNLDDNPNALHFSPDSRLLYAQDFQHIHIWSVPDFLEQTSTRSNPRKLASANFYGILNESPCSTPITPRQQGSTTSLFVICRHSV